MIKRLWVSFFFLLLISSKGFAYTLPDVFMTDERQKLEEKGLSFEASYLGDLVSNVQGGLHERTTYRGNFDLGLTYDLGQAGFIPGGKIYASLNNTHGGENPTAKFIGDLQGVDNIEAPDAIRFYEWWYEQQLFKEKLSLLAGVQGLDSEFAISDYGALFIHSSFGTSPEMSWNVPLSIFPWVGPAARVKIKPFEWLDLLYGIYDGDPSDGGKNRHDVDYRLSEHQGLLHIWEAGVHYALPVMGKELSGSFKFGSWIHTQDLDDVQKLQEDGSFVRHDRDYGFYGVMDQMLYREPSDSDQGLGVFFQLGGAPSDRNFVDRYFGTGLHYKGLLPKRDQDIFGVAVANAFLSDHSKRERKTAIDSYFAANPGGVEAPRKFVSPESALEFTYRIQLHERLAVQPDYQIVFHPGGEEGSNTAHVFLLRFEITY